MAWTDPGDFTSGQILTAGEMDNIREAMFFGQATFTNEAARDTAYGASMSPIVLAEGMRAYLTAPTVPAATGSSTLLPSGVTTIYNGTNWPCITPLGALSNTTATTTSATYVTTLTGDATAISVTLVTGTSALVSFGGLQALNAAGTVLMSVSVSGATTLAATDENAIYMGLENRSISQQYQYVLGGLTAGTNTFTLRYRTTAGTATYYRRHLVVEGIA